MDAKNSEIGRLRSRLDEAGEALRPKMGPALERWRTAAAELDSLLSSERTMLEGAKRDVAALQNRIESRFEEIDALSDLLNGHREPLQDAGRGTGNPDVQRRYDVSTRELATLSRLLRTAEDRASWLGNVNSALAQCPSWWRFMPMGWQKRKQADRLQRKGLFDAQAYLQRYPDVAQAGMNPLRHYIEHGQAEGRLR
ncbi:MAG TPA: hypothetical protein VF503_03855 [Sphingobium sp.]|uniref:hypothetical protein n=1 Tax=Sphingobium sp. TaxID=1912891 RepID=UPI002ED3C308